MRMAFGVRSCSFCTEVCEGAQSEWGTQRLYLSAFRNARLEPLCVPEQPLICFVNSGWNWKVFQS